MPRKPFNGNLSIIRTRVSGEEITAADLNFTAVLKRSGNVEARGTQFKL